MKKILYALVSCTSLLSLLSKPLFALPIVTITQIEINNDSARVYYLPVPGAVDYRAYTTENPKQVKYAGVTHHIAPDGEQWVVGADGKPAFPYRPEPISSGGRSVVAFDAPKLDIECNGLVPKVPVHIVVEAVDALGPAPLSNLATDVNGPRVKGGSKAAPMAMTMDSDADSMPMLGSNSGPTDDGLYSINGQGGPHAWPHPIARSIPALITPTGIRALPSVGDAEQVVFDTFGSGRIDPIPSSRSIKVGNQSYMMHSDQDWRIDFLSDDIAHSRPFIMNRHFMDVLFDGGTPGSNLPLHVTHGSMVMAPIKTADFSGGRVLHVTMEVDAHVDPRRWVAFILTPHDAPLTSVYFFGIPVNKPNLALFCDFNRDSLSMNQFAGFGADKKLVNLPLVGAAGQADSIALRPIHAGYSGRGLDSRSRFDLFVTKHRYVVLEDGQKIADQKFPGNGLPEAMLKTKVYFVHYLYHSGNEITDVRLYAPWENPWLNLFPFSDERHWDNMGFEVLPQHYAQSTTNDFIALTQNARSVKDIQASDLESR